MAVMQPLCMITEAVVSVNDGRKDENSPSADTRGIYKTGNIVHNNGKPFLTDVGVKLKPWQKVAD